MGPRRLPVLLALAAAVALLAGALARITIRTDMAAFLPAGSTPAARLILEEARTGTASGLLFMGIEGAPVPELARISRAMVATLEGTGLFAVVAGGQAALPEGQMEALFARRYLLAPADFSEAGLHAGLVRLLRELRGAAGPLAAKFGLADPPGAFVEALKAWSAGSAVRPIDGAWFAPERDRALLLARTKAGGLDVAGQEAASAAIQAAFAAARPGAARLLVAGPAIFARDSARAIRGDVERISVLSTLLVAGLLWWRFRSPLVIAAIAAPVVASVGVAALVVQAVFGSVHGVALGFGATMLGIAVDYPVLMIGHRKRGEAAPATRARIARAFVLAVATATTGLGAVLFSGFPGLMQLGVFAATGLLITGLLTWFALPPLVVAANLAPTAADTPGWLPRLERLRRFRGLLVVPLGAAVVALAGGVQWETDLAALSPIPEASRALDRALRGELGAGESGQFLLVRETDAEAVLEEEERLFPALEGLVGRGGLEGFDAAARLVPSAATQRARQAGLPEGAALAGRLGAALEGLPFRREAFEPFLAGVAASRGLAPLTPGALAGTPLGTRLAPLLQETAGGWRGVVPLHGLRDPAGLPAGSLFIDLKSELGGVLAGYTARAWRLLAMSAAVILVLLGVGLRDPVMAARTLGAIGVALLLTVAALTAAGVRLSLIHLVALPLVAGVGLDYALFFARRQLDAEERARTVRTLLTCNGMTLLTFGLLAVSETPVLRDLGVTVATGAFLALLSGFLITGEAPSHSA